VRGCCSDTQPFFLASLVARFPVMALFVMFLLLSLAAAPAALPRYRPRTNNDFRSLLVRDHDSAAMVFADESLVQFRQFWAISRPPADAGRRRLQHAPSSDSATLIADRSSSSSRSLSVASSQRSLLQAARTRKPPGGGTIGGDGLRTDITRMLNIFYRYSDNSTAITQDMTTRVRAPCHGACMCAAPRSS
jgi:hypothetical protein